MSKALGKIVIVFALVGIVTLGWYKWFRHGGNQTDLDASSTNKLMVVNVLGLDQYDDCHIKGSVHMPFDKFEEYAQKLDKDTEMVFYCSNYMCTGSGVAAKTFKKHGFEKVWAYEAGMAEWYNKGLPVVGPCKAKYLSMKNNPVEKQEDDVDVISTIELKNKLGL